MYEDQSKDTLSRLDTDQKKLTAISSDLSQLLSETEKISASAQDQQT